MFDMDMHILAWFRYINVHYISCLMTNVIEIKSHQPTKWHPVIQNSSPLILVILHHIIKLIVVTGDLQFALIYFTMLVLSFICINLLQQ